MVGHTFSNHLPSRQQLTSQGLQICHDEAQVRASFASVVSRGSTLFANAGVFLERFYPISRHIEVQVFGDGHGDCIVLGERECSIQRRHQKVLEETPSPFLETRPALRQTLFAVSRRLGQHIRYRSAGTIEYLVDDATGDFFFLEMNTRLQVEHGITELCFDVDLVDLMLRLADGSLCSLEAYRGRVPSGHAVEARVYAENPLRNYMPSPGVLQQVSFPGSDCCPGVRIDTWVRTGTNISLAFDPMLAKVMAHGATREEATARLRDALKETQLRGIVTNRDLLVAVLEAPDFIGGRTTTGFLHGFRYVPQVLEIVVPGSYTTVQDYPGRIGVGSGIPQGGPMDTLHGRLANVLVGNAASAAHLEITLVGPTLHFHVAAVIAVAGASAPEMRLGDGSSVPMFAAVAIPADSVLTVGKLEGGNRTYLAIRGGLPGIPAYLGSQATSPIAGIGGLQGRPLAAGDQLELVERGTTMSALQLPLFALPRALVPEWDRSIVYCLSGPHDSPDIVKQVGLQALYEGEWTVSHQASRVGICLQGPPAQWARATGGTGGSHPSNYIDYPYSVGALNWTGDSAVLFPADAPSLGGFVSSHVVPSAELTKLAQLRPGDRFRLAPIRLEAAVALRQRQTAFLNIIAGAVAGTIDASSVMPLSLTVGEDGMAPTDTSQAILATVGDAILRQAGDAYVLIEFGQRLDLETRCRVQSVVERVDQSNLAGVRLTTAIGCSLLIEYDALELAQADLVRFAVSLLQATRISMPTTLVSRVVRLPMVFDDQANRTAVARYMQTQRASAAYLPDPVAFIARANGLPDKDALRRCVLASRVLVVGVGFFNGTPIGLPLDPRCRLNVPKFNPPRTFSPAGGLGFGGSFVTCDPIDAPGGYVNFGRTLPGWDQFGMNASFAGGRPWLFNNFDQIEFYEVSEAAFETLHARFRAGQFNFDIRPAVFDVAAHARFCTDVAAETAAFQQRQMAAAAVETAREKVLFEQWQAEQQITSTKDTLTSLDGIGMLLYYYCSLYCRSMLQVNIVASHR